MEERGKIPNREERSQEIEDATSRWAVWRQDDNGGTFLVASGLTEAEARSRAEALEATGHKQTYWAARG